MIAKSHRWQKTALAVAATAVLGLWGTHSSALSLGRIAVLSALGEPLRAEIDIPDITADEADSLKTSVASPDAFRAAGVDYNPVMGNLQISLQKRPDGRSFLRVSSDRPVNDPYVDLILEASWSSGRIVRDYTMLFDPPNLRQPQAVTPTAPQISSPLPPRSAPAAAPAATAPATAVPATPRTRTSPAARAAAEPAVKPAPEAVPGGKQINVKSGDSASKIAAANRLPGVSLDQMLVAMLRANPDAFINGNVNRLRSGAVVTLPGTEDAQATSADEARQIIVAQSKDFNEFRRKLAGSAPLSQVAGPDRRASGKVEAQVEEKKTAPTAPDKLTLSKGAVQSQGSEDKIAQARSAKEAANRAEELSKNIAELSKLSAAASAPTSAASAPEPATAAAPVAEAATAEASAPQLAASAPVAAASTPAVRPPVAAPAPMPVEEPSLLDEILDNPMVPAAAAGLIALLAGLGIYRVRQRRQAATMDSSFMESKLQPDSFFGASGGQRVDTHDGATGSSMVYSPSQLDAADDVDPVAEADVYLAYGRDLQAEEILKEALRAHPDRLAIQLKLLEIYAKRRDVRAFENIATGVHRQTGGEGTEWNRVCELGLGIDPGNDLYQPGGLPNSAAAPQVAAEEPSVSAAAAEPEAVAELAPSTPTVDLDLDLDFSLDDEPRPAAAPAAEPVATAPPAVDLDFDLPAELPQVADNNSLDFDVEAPTLATDAEQAASVAAASESKPADSGALEFDLGSLSLDLDGPTTEQTPVSDDPLATKLALAEEFSAIGDTDGARALIEEIIAEATGDMKAKAQEALSRLG